MMATTTALNTKVLYKLEREPKVACVELGCVLRDASKNNSTCTRCIPRWRFLGSIENGGAVALAGVQTAAGFDEEVEFPILSQFERK